ncbi:MAG: DinB family protein [Thermoanaerobaculia bacterium]
MRKSLLLVASVLLGSSLAFAQAPTTTSTQISTRPATAPAAPSGFRADFLVQLDMVGKQIVDLAEAVPADKYGWRPAPGVRSISEVYMHIVGGNSYIPSFIGVKPMEGIERGMEKSVTEKARVVDLLKKSMAHARAAVLATPDADLDKKVKIFGGEEASERAVIMIIGNHLHEHLGQSIAYARANGITPPWSKGGQ